MTKVIPLKTRRNCTEQQGKVSLIGAGPGDPELLTLKAARLLNECDTVVFDRLVNPEILEHCRPECESIYVGKVKDHHSMPQDKICELLVALAGCGKRVVRLKGGDPFLFGRGGEEIDVLEAADISWEVVPGITAATGCAASTGIPLTHRDHAHAITFITGHRKQGELDINWQLATQNDQTVVFYMGLSNLQEIASTLISKGKPASTPIAVIANGTQSKEQTVIGDLSNIAAKTHAAKLPSPALLVMGDVVLCREQLALLRAS